MHVPTLALPSPLNPVPRIPLLALTFPDQRRAAKLLSALGSSALFPAFPIFPAAKRELTITLPGLLTVC